MDKKIDEKLLSIMACPKCRGDIELTESGDFVFCSPCSLKYRVEEGIPIMLLDDSEEL